MLVHHSHYFYYILIIMSYDISGIIRILHNHHASLINFIERVKHTTF